jgi:YggT family protein
MNALTEILGYLLQTLLSLYMLAMLLRFLLQWARADFYNPLSQFLVKVTNPLVVPLRRLVPGLGGLDLATLLLVVLLQALGITAMLLLNGLGLPNLLLLLVWSLLGVAGLLINVYFFAVLAVIILSWVAPGTGHPAVTLLYQLTEPVMAPLRRLLPATGGFDLSPILLFIGINVLQILLRHGATAVGLHPALVIGL